MYFPLCRYKDINFVISEVWDWNVKLSCETNFFLFSWKSDIDKNGSLNSYTTDKNYQNLLQKWWWWVYGNFSNKKMKHISHSMDMLIKNCSIWGSDNPHVIEERPLHPEKVAVWCTLWSEGMIGWHSSQYVSNISACHTNNDVIFHT